MSEARPDEPALDADCEVGDRYDQPVRRGVVGELHDYVGRMPPVVAFDDVRS